MKKNNFSLLWFKRMVKLAQDSSLESIWAIDSTFKTN